MRTPEKDMPDLNFDKNTNAVTIPTPVEFSFVETLKYLSRSTEECLHLVKGDKVYKLLEVEQETLLVEIGAETPASLKIRFVDGSCPPAAVWNCAVHYIRDWFDLQTDLIPFYQLAKEDLLLERLTSDYFGLRIIGIPDLFEALCWAIIGQQINLAFAYTLKKRFVEMYGRHVEWQGNTFWQFPKPREIASLAVDDLRKLQFTGKKAEYVLGIAELIESGQLSKQSLLETDDFQAAEQTLLSIRGIGPWTAHYVLMRCLRDPSAFPIGDAGLQNALKQQLNRTQKPSEPDIRQLFSSWRNWEAYAVFYLWRSLEP